MRSPKPKRTVSQAKHHSKLRSQIPVERYDSIAVEPDALEIDLASPTPSAWSM
ncbi:MAG: hypothetical protein GX161_03125 [Firmicutes bacterium]|nr:hypothetical protein [Bacillota bacterium]